MKINIQALKDAVRGLVAAAEQSGLITVTDEPGAAKSTGPVRLAWTDAESTVCGGCGSVVQRDLWATHLDLHRRIDAAAGKREGRENMTCGTHGQYACQLCALNPSCCADPDDDDLEAEAACTAYRSSGMHAEHCDQRVTAISGTGQWRLGHNEWMDPGEELHAGVVWTLNDKHARDIAALNDKLRSEQRSNSDMLARQIRWQKSLTDAVSTVAHLQGTQPVDALINYARGLCNEVERLRRLEATVADLGAGRMGSDKMCVWLQENVSRHITEPVDQESAAACPSLYLRDGRLIKCLRSGSHPDSMHDGGTGPTWGDTNAVPSPWPPDLEPPAGINALHAPLQHPSLPYLVRVEGGWAWARSAQGVDRTGAVSWESCMNVDLIGDALNVVQP